MPTHQHDDGLWKVIENDGQPELFDAVGGHLVAIIDDEKPLSKQAASDVVDQSILEKYRPPKDYFLGHAISHGDSEWYSFNKNGDFWPEEENKKHAHTFVKYGAYYPEHDVRPETRKGIIKAAFHNPKMHWTEVVFWGHRKKASADYEDAKSGKPRAYSISAHVKSDTCSICKNKSRRRKDYCKHANHMLTTYIPGINKFAYLVNNDPTFYDLSDVGRPADRVAVTLGYMLPEGDLKKAASEGATPSTDIAARLKIGERGGVYKFSADANRLIKFAVENRELLQAESDFENGTHLEDDDITRLRDIRTRTLFSKMASTESILPLPEFVAYVTGHPLSKVASDKNIAAVRKNIPDYESIASLPSSVSIFNQFTTDALNPPDPCYDIHQRGALNKVASFYTLPAVTGEDTEGLLKRASYFTPVTAEEKTEELFSPEEAEAFNAVHGIYKLACASEISLHRGSSFLDSDKFKAIIQLR